MILYQYPLDSYDTDSFNMGLNAGAVFLDLTFIWPTEMQEIHDNLVLGLDSYFKNISYFQLHDLDTYFQIGYSAAQIDLWRRFLSAFDEHNVNELRDVLDESAWPVMLKQDVIALDQAQWEDSTGQWMAPTELYAAMGALFTNLDPELEYLAYIDSQLYWRLYITTSENHYSAVLYPNCWLFQGFSYIRLYAESPLERIGRDQLGSVNLIVAIGDGEVA